MICILLVVPNHFHYLSLNLQILCNSKIFFRPMELLVNSSCVKKFFSCFVFFIHLLYVEMLLPFTRPKNSKTKHVFRIKSFFFGLRLGRRKNIYTVFLIRPKRGKYTVKEDFGKTTNT